MIFCDFIEQLRTGRFRAIENNGDESVATVLLLDFGELKEMTPFNNSFSSKEEVFAYFSVLEEVASEVTIAVAEEATAVGVTDDDVSANKGTPEVGTGAFLPVGVQKRRRSVNIGKYVAFLSRAQSFSS